MLPEQHRVVLHIPGCGVVSTKCVMHTSSDLREDISYFASSSRINLRLRLSFLNDVAL